MAQVILLSEATLKQRSILQDNVDMKVVSPAILDVQEEYILPILGTSLYNDLLEQVKTNTLTPDYRTLLDDYISREEIWACTSCNACTEACPINIDPLAIIVDLRRYAVMEESEAPASINAMLGNVENNGAPWKYSPADRLNWAEGN
jgi:Fe-S oxidoreductase